MRSSVFAKYAESKVSKFVGFDRLEDISSHCFEMLNYLNANGPPAKNQRLTLEQIREITEFQSHRLALVYQPPNSKKSEFLEILIPQFPLCLQEILPFERFCGPINGRQLSLELARRLKLSFIPKIRVIIPKNEIKFPREKVPFSHETKHLFALQRTT